MIYQPTRQKSKLIKDHHNSVRTEPNHIIISDVDHGSLTRLIHIARRDPRHSAGNLAALETELRRAHIVPASEISEEVVTMNSIVRLRDLETDEIEELELVYPQDADMAQNRISVLAPIGTAILGYRIGDVIEWPVPAGVRRFIVEELLFQPERVQALAVNQN